LIAIVTQCFQPDVGGIETLMTGLADQIALSGRAVAVFADHVRTASATELERPYPIHRFGAIRPLRARFKRQAIARAMASGIAGIFADSWKSIGALPAGAGPVAVLAHGTEFSLDAPAHKARRINQALKRARTIVASSRYTATLVNRFTAGVEAAVIVVNPPIDQLPRAEAPALARVDAILAGRGPVISTLARLEPRKGVDTVIRAVAELRPHYPGIVYLVAGAGGDLDRLRGLAAQCGCADAVVFVGQVSDPQTRGALLTRSDVHAMPSRRVGDSVEGYGIAYVEAGWYGAPSLAGRDGGALDAVGDGETGLVCDGADQRDVTRALARLLDDAPLRRRLGAAAQTHAFGQTWHAGLPRYLAALGM
jgi:phosphatidylinositol alpha-1,6-mannosyltransferase